MRVLSAFLLLALLASPLLVAADETAEASEPVVSAGTAQLLVQKSLDHNPVMPWNFPLDTPVNVTLTVVNIGDGAAFDVVLEDSWLSGFELSGSSGTNKWEQIAAGASVSVSYFVTPQQEGEFESAPARVTYAPKEGAPTRTGYSSSATNLNIITAEQFAKLTSTHALEWSVFFSLFALFVAAPALKYFELSSSYVKSGRRKAE